MATQSSRSLVSETSICNQALTWLGQSAIRSLDDNGDAAEWMRVNYAQIRDAVLQTRKWSFATVKAVSTSQDLDAWGILYLHPRPLNWLSVFRVYSRVNVGGLTIDKSFRMEGGNVVSRWATVYMWGIEQVTDTAKFSPLFVQALAARIAADAAVALTQDRATQRDMWGLYEAKLSEAAAIDGQEGGNDVIESNSLIEARYGADRW